jgi:hypothetical protein
MTARGANNILSWLWRGHYSGWQCSRNAAGVTVPVALPLAAEPASDSESRSLQVSLSLSASALPVPLAVAVALAAHGNSTLQAAIDLSSRRGPASL